MHISPHIFSTKVSIHYTVINFALSTYKWILHMFICHFVQLSFILFNGCSLLHQLNVWPIFHWRTFRSIIFTRIFVVKFLKQDWCWEIKTSGFAKFQLAQTITQLNSTEPLGAGVSLPLFCAEGKTQWKGSFPGLMRDIEALQADMETCFICVSVLA